MSTRVSAHREKLLREGMRQVYARGFHGTTVDSVLEASGVPKGSFYHHFGGKEAFTAELLRRYTTAQMDLLDAWSERPGLTTAQALAGYFREIADGIIASEFQRACLIGKLASELAASNDDFRRQLDSDIGAWKERMGRMFERGQQRGDVRTDQTATELADVALALIQGAFVVTLATRDARSLDSVAAALEALLG